MKKLDLWNLKEGRIVASFNDEKTRSLSLSVSTDGNFIALGMKEGTIILFDVRQEKIISRLRAHTALVKSLNFTPDSETLVSTSNDGTARFWKVATGQLALTLLQRGGINGASLSQDGSLLATGGEDGTVVTD